MRILNIMQCTNLGGMEQASLRLMEALMRRGHRCEVLSLNPLGELKGLLEEAGVPAQGLPYLGKMGWRSIPKFRQKLRGANAEALLMTGHSLMAMLNLGGFCRGRRVLAIHHYHEQTRPDWQWKLFYRLVRRFYSGVVYPADFVRMEAERIHPAIADLAWTVRNPLELVPLPTMEDRLRARCNLGLPADARVIGGAGWLVPNKRWDLFLKVAVRLSAVDPAMRIVIAGNGIECDALKAMAVRLRLQDRILWLGWCQDLVEFYRALDAVLFISDRDTFSNTPQEAALHGVPTVVAVRQGGLKEVITDNETSFITDSHDVALIARRMLTLLQDRELARRFVLKFRTLLTQVAAPDSIAAVYETLLEGKTIASPAEHGKAMQGRTSLPPAEMPRRCRSSWGAENGRRNDTGREAAATAELAYKQTQNLPVPSGFPVRVVGLILTMIPYHHARWQAYARTVPGFCAVVQVTNRNDFKVLDDCAGESAYELVTLCRDRSRSKVRIAELRRTVNQALDRLQPSVVCVNGYSLEISLAGMEWCMRHSVRMVMCSESNEFDEPRNFVKEAVKRRLVEMCGSGLAGGQPQADYLRLLGMRPTEISVGYDCVDNAHFAHGAQAARGAASVIRSQLGLPGHYFLACARFEEKKNHLRLIDAYARYREMAGRSQAGRQMAGDGEPWSLLLVGDGELRPQVEKRIADLGLRNHVILPGAKRYDELPAYYGLADAFIHPSTVEQWGLVVNEAMAAGLPVLVSNHCGSATDLVHDGENGFTFDPYDGEQLAQLMRRISAFGFPLSAFGNASQRIMEDWDPDRYASGLCEAVEAALHKPAPGLSLDTLLLLRVLGWRRGPN